jgi:hypothetical protein
MSQQHNVRDVDVTGHCPDSNGSEARRLLGEDEEREVIPVASPPSRVGATSGFALRKRPRVIAPSGNVRTE